MEYLIECATDEEYIGECYTYLTPAEVVAYELWLISRGYYEG